MANLTYGVNRQVQFSNEEEFFFTLGFLAKSDGSTSLSWENNSESGAWGNEGRIHCYSNLIKFPAALANAFTTGTGCILKRVNCNEFVKLLNEEYFFVFGGVQDADAIRANVPDEYKEHFDNGLTS